MKTNLDGLYKTNSDEEKNGIWYQVSDTTKFLVKRFGGGNTEAVKRSLARHQKPYALRIQKGTLDPKIEDEINARVFAESCLVGWEGVQAGNKELEFNTDNAVKLLLSLPELMADLFAFSQSVDTFKEDVGNS